MTPARTAAGQPRSQPAPLAAGSPRPAPGRVSALISASGAAEPVLEPAGAALAGEPAAHVVIPSPVGPLTLTAAGGALTGLYMQDHQYPPGPGRLGVPGDVADGPFAAAAAQLGAYFAGDLAGFDVPVRLAGTPFQVMVWAALRGIGYGGTVSYGELAARLGRPAASRAVGLANGKNPVSIVLPCHRVIGADGSLTGYGGGLPRKRYLLDLERRGAGPGQAWLA